jgi:hypothetical protein
LIFTATPPGPPPAQEKGAPRQPIASKSDVGIRRKRPNPPPDEDEDEEEEEEKPRERKKGVRRPEVEEEDEDKPRLRRKAVRRRAEDEEEDEEDEDEDEEDEEEEERPRTRRPRRTGTSPGQRARSAVFAPAICLIVVGALGIALAGAGLAINLGGLTLFAPEEKEDDGSGKVQWVSSQARSIRGSITALCWGLAVLGGGIQMKNLKGYKSVMTSCILAMLPCNPCCFLGIPFGIWGLVAINRWDVKREFD